MEYVKYDSSNRIRLKELGIDLAALDAIFAPKGAGSPLLHLDGMDAAQRYYYQREMDASQRAYDTIRDGELIVPDIFSGKRTRISQSRSITPEFTSGFVSVPIAYCIAEPVRHYLICTGLSGRFSQIYVPGLNVVIYDLHEDIARKLGALFENGTPETTLPSPTGRVIGVVDMVTNFGHQLINHLSGIDRLCSLGLQDHLSEIWISGADFFGDPRRLFPVLSEKIIIFRDRHELAARLFHEGNLAVRLGSYYLGRKLRHAIISNAGRRLTYTNDTFPIVALTIRGSGRTCTNLVDVAHDLFAGIKDHYPDVRLILDGWTFPDSEMLFASPPATAIWSKNRSGLTSDLEVAKSISEKLPKNAILRTTIGMSMMDSVSALQGIDTYFAHVGTLQHKLGFLTNAPGVVHGPYVQIHNNNPGTYQVESGHPPKFIPSNVVEDIATPGPRGVSFNDYRIKETATILDLLLSDLRLAEQMKVP